LSSRELSIIIGLVTRGLRGSLRTIAGQIMTKLFRLEEGWSTTLFLLGAILAAGWAVVAARWAEGLGIVPIAGVGGLAAGLFLGWSVFRSRTSHLFSAVFGLTWVGFLLGLGLPGDFTWGERITGLVVRLSNWLDQVLTGGKGHDTLIFVMLLSGLFWALGYNAAWNTYRRMRVWYAILPPGIVALVTVYYYFGSAPLMRYLAFYLFFALLYIARAHAFEQEEGWRRERVVYDPGLRFDFVRAGLVLTLIGLVLAWTLPGAEAWPGLAETWRRFSTPWHAVQEEWQRLFSTLSGGAAARPVEPFGPSLALGGPREERDLVVMDIAAPHEGRYYWRGAVYSYYGGDEWETLEDERILLTPGRQPPGMADDALRRPVIQTVTSFLPGSHLLVGASQPVAVGWEAQASVDLMEHVPLELIRIFSVLPLEAGSQYLVSSQVSDADATSLREAGADYPDWVRQRYLQLPASLPDRVHLLAEELAAGAESPYDQAIALEQYLRHNITYDLTPPDLPAGRDYVDFLLFDSQRGYCSGYASAMVVLARSVGMPARLAAGYAEGEYDQERGVFRVREVNAHSWVEVYFPGYGWIEFEPTASEAPLIRPERAEEQAAESQVLSGEGARDLPGDIGARGSRDLSEMDDVLEAENEPLAPRRRSLTWSLAAGFAFVVLVVGGWWATENWGFRGLSPVERTYARLLRLGRWLGRPLGVSDTPFEWVQDVSTIVPEARGPMDSIVDLYVCARFARGNPAAPEARAAWRRARPVLWRGWLRHIFFLPRRHRG
jgi:transglutaminase-like putative cysteine protease